MDLAIGLGESRRERGAFTPWRQENCLIEPTKTDPKKFNILSRPPLVEEASYGDGPTHKVFSKEGLFSGALFAVIGDGFYRDGLLIGTIGGTGPVSLAAGNNEIVLTRGASAYSYDGTDLQAIAFPDGADVRAVLWMARRFVFVRKGTGRFYWSDLDDGRTIDPLNYASAESEQDELLDVKRSGDLMWLLGSASGEAWMLTGDPDAPWSKVSQRVLERGVRDTGCAEEIDGTIYFVADDQTVRVIANAPVRISDGALDEKIAASETASTFWFQFEGKALLCVRLDSGTHVLDLTLENQPAIFSTVGRTNWAPSCATQRGAEVLFGDDADGTIWKFEEGAATDSGQLEMRRVFTAGTAGNSIRIANVLVNGNTGSTPADEGIAADPLMQMRCSRDGGRTFGPSKAARWGRKGDYRRQARFGNCGQFGSPGFLAEFTMTACVPLRVSAVRVNEKVAGRGRI